MNNIVARDEEKSTPLVVFSCPPRPRMALPACLPTCESVVNICQKAKQLQHFFLVINLIETRAEQATDKKPSY